MTREPFFQVSEIERGDPPECLTFNIPEYTWENSSEGSGKELIKQRDDH